MNLLARSVVAIAAVSLGVAPALAQTANSSPTAPADGGAASTAGPSTGNMVPQAGTSKIGAPSATELKEQAKSEKDMSICKGC